MKTDEELRERLCLASRMAEPPGDPVQRLYRRRDANHRRERLTAGALAMALFLAVAGGSLYALRGEWGGHRDVVTTDGGGTGSLALGPGQDFYLDIHVVVQPIEQDGQQISEGGKAIITSWWATDGSGRI